MKNTTEPNESLDNTATVEDLKRRAKQSRRARLYIALGLLVLMSLAVAAVFSSSQAKTYSLSTLAEKISFNKMRDPGLFLRKSNDLLEKIYPDNIINMGRRMDGEDVKEEKFTTDERAAYMRELEQLVKFYERTQTAYSKQPFVQETPDWTSSVSSMAFTFGAIAISILLFQTAVSFIRYYSQLAELYDSQASALLAANNDPEKFVKYSEILSPSAVNFGKSPVSVYERAFEAIASIRGKETK